MVTIVLKRSHPRPPHFVEAAVWGRTGGLEPFASTLPDIVEPAIRERVGEWNRLHQRPQISLRLPFEEEGSGLHSGFTIALSD